MNKVVKCTNEEKYVIAKKIKNTSEEDAIKDYKKLKKIDLSKVSNETRIGNKFVDRFTFLARLETISKKGISYFEFIYDTNYHEKKYIKKLLDYQQGDDFHVSLYRVFKLHCGSIGLFKPLNAMEIYARFKPQSVLDFTMGWGGRLVGACVQNVPNYIGIDTNQSLKEPYGEMVKLLEKMDIHTNIKLMFEDALNVDYSTLEYDMVFTSPPYYNIEIYEGSSAKTDQEWINDFYIPIFNKTYKHLKPAGHFILNVPMKLYEEICLDLFGPADLQIALKKKTRPKNSFTKKDYNEYMYVWCKPPAK